MSGVESTEPSTDGEAIDVAAEIPPELAAEGFVDVSPSKDCGVLKLVKQVGYDTDCPVVDDNISVHYVATLADGNVQYDSTDSTRECEKPFNFRLGKGLLLQIIVQINNNGGRVINNLRYIIVPNSIYY